MTIITKPISEKKELKPPVEDPSAIPASAPLEDDVESQASIEPPFVLLRTRARRVSMMTTLCLLIAALFAVGVGIIAGVHLYRQYLRSQIFKGWCSIPYEQNEAMYLQSTGDKDINQYIDEMARAMGNDIRNSFKEEFEIDTVNEDYEKITVPDFKDGRMGRFVHDFSFNLTGIIDISGKRCFVFPLDRNNTLQPRSMMDTIMKMYEGYYKVDTQVIREEYDVELPAIANIDDVGNYISSECRSMPIYRLKKLINRVYKRSADLHDEAKFVHFSGRNVMEFDIMNLDAVNSYEKKLH